MLECRDIFQSYGEQPVLTDVSLTVQAGELHQVAGPSGGGKTTLLRVLCLLEKPLAGTVLLDNEEFCYGDIFGRAAWIRSERFRKVITLVSQQIFLWPHLTCRKNIEMAGNGNAHQQLAKELNVHGCLDRYPNEVSVGQRQRLALIRAIATKPRFLILDEVTSALDTAMAAVATALLERLVEKGIGIILVTHRQHDWKRVQPRNWWIEHGRLT